MKTLSAHITSFYHSSFHAYTTEVSVDGHRWRLGLRYSKFHDFYDLLLQAAGKDFQATFPPKGTLFFTPKPEERQQQLEEFLQQVLAYYESKGCPTDIEDLLCDLLKVPQHLRDPNHEDDNVSTSTESVLSEPVHDPPTESVADEPKEEKIPAPLEPEKSEAKVVEEAAVEEEEAAVVEEEEAVSEPTESAVGQQQQPDEEEVAAEPTEPIVEEISVEEQQQPSDEEEHVAEEALVEPQQPIEETATEEATVQQEADPVVEADEEDPADQDEVEDAVGETDDEVVVKDSIAPTPAEEIEKEAAIAEPITHEPEVTTANEEAAAEPDFEPVAEDVVDPVTQTPETALPKVQPAAENPVETKLEKKTIQEEPHPTAQRQNEKKAGSEELLGTPQRTSTSWLSAYLPKSVLGFIRHRCMKKTNIVMLCVAILLPMVLARR